MSRLMISSDSASKPTTGIILYLRVKSSHRNQALRLIEISMKHRKRMMMNSSDPDCGYRAEPADINAQQPNILGACTSSYHTLYEQPLPLPLFLTNCLSLLELRTSPPKVDQWCQATSVGTPKEVGGCCSHCVSTMRMRTREVSTNDRKLG